jgi:hypothetical protein
VSANINLSNKGSPTKGNTQDSNNYSLKKDDPIEECDTQCDPKSITVTITKHLCNPCPGFYSDIFRSIKIVCEDPSHKSNERVDLEGEERLP